MGLGGVFGVETGKSQMFVAGLRWLSTWLNASGSSHAIVEVQMSLKLMLQFARLPLSLAR